MNEQTPKEKCVLTRKETKSLLRQLLISQCNFSDGLRILIYFKKFNREEGKK
jgi:hypothetical protein